RRGPAPADRRWRMARRDPPRRARRGRLRLRPAVLGARAGADRGRTGFGAQEHAQPPRRRHAPPAYPTRRTSALTPPPRGSELAREPRHLVGAGLPANLATSWERTCPRISPPRGSGLARESRHLVGAGLPANLATSWERACPRIQR